MINKQLYLFVVTGLLIIGGLFPSTRTLAVTLEGYENVPQARYWDRISKHLATTLIERGRLGLNTIYVDRKPSAIEVGRYIEEQLSFALIKSNAKVVSSNSARFVIELDVEVNKRSDGHGTVYVVGGDVDELWRIEKLDPSNVVQPRLYQMVPLAMNQPVSVNPLSGTDTEIIITARIMEKGWILVSQNYAFYFTAESLRPARGPSHEKKLKAENDFEVDALQEFQSHHRVFLDYQHKLDTDAQQLIDRYQF